MCSHCGLQPQLSPAFQLPPPRGARHEREAAIFEVDSPASAGPAFPPEVPHIMEQRDKTLRPCPVQIPDPRTHGHKNVVLGHRICGGLLCSNSNQNIFLKWGDVQRRYGVLPKSFQLASESLKYYIFPNAPIAFPLYPCRPQLLPPLGSSLVSVTLDT